MTSFAALVSRRLSPKKSDTGHAKTTCPEMIHAESFGLAKQCDDFVKHATAEKTHR